MKTDEIAAVGSRTHSARSACRGTSRHTWKHTDPCTQTHTDTEHAQRFPSTSPIRAANTKAPPLNELIKGKARHFGKNTCPDPEYYI